MSLAAQQHLWEPPTWLSVKDGDDDARRLFDRHYSRSANPDPRGYIAGPGERLILLTPCARALFLWRAERYRMDDQEGINCAIFRNEGAGLSSFLIEEADALADMRWPGERHYTFVDPKRVRSPNPGCCFLKAGWRRCGTTKINNLLILERLP